MTSKSMWCVKQLDASVSLMPCSFLLNLEIHTRCITCSVLPVTANSSGLEWSVQRGGTVESPGAYSDAALSRGS